MRKLLRTKKVTIDGIGDVEIRELTGADQNALVQYDRDHKDDGDKKNDHVLALMCSLGVPEFEGASLEEIEASVGWDVLRILSAAISEFSGVKAEADPKAPSPADPSAPSSTG